MPRANLRGPLGGPLGGSEDRKDVKTESANWRRNSLALEKGHIKHSEQYWAPRGTTNPMKETKKLSGYAGWSKISNWREEIGASGGIRTTEKEWMIMSRIAMMKNPVKLALTKGGIIPGNHADKGPDPIPEDHINIGTIHARRGRADEVVLIPRNQGNKDTAHVRTNILAEAQTPPRMKGLTMRPWMQ